MPQWVELFQNHPVHEQLRVFKRVLAEIEEDPDLELEEVPGKELAPEFTESLERLKQIGNYTEKAFSTLDPFLTPKGVLDNINSQLQQAVTHCNQYQSNGNVSLLDQANNQAEAILLQLGSLPSIRTHEELEGLSEAIVSFRRSVGQYNRYVYDENEGIQAQIEAAKEELEGLTNNITAQQTRLDEVVSEFQRQFSESEERRRSEFADGEKDRETRFREREENHIIEFRTFVEEQSARSEKHVEETQAHKKRAEELVYVIGNTGMVGGYQRIANDERKVAVRWQVVAVIAFVGLIAFAVFAFIATLGGEVSWQAFGARLFVALSFGILAAYAARQAERHEFVERSSRRLELALASIDPYLVSLPEETRHEVKQALAMKFFGEAPGIQSRKQRRSMAPRQISCAWHSKPSTNSLRDHQDHLRVGLRRKAKKRECMTSCLTKPMPSKMLNRLRRFSRRSNSEASAFNAVSAWRSDVLGLGSISSIRSCRLTT